MACHLIPLESRNHRAMAESRDDPSIDHDSVNVLEWSRFSVGHPKSMEATVESRGQNCSSGIRSARSAFG